MSPVSPIADIEKMCEKCNFGDECSDELLEALWKILYTFAQIGHGIDPTYQKVA